MDVFIDVVFWASAALIVYAYMGYPALVWACSRLFGRRPTPPVVADADLPSISLLIAAHNEEAVIKSRIENALCLDYPRDKLQIAVASDGSSDATVDIAREFLDKGVAVLAYPNRRGKTAVLNESMPGLRGELVALSDANVYMAPSSLRSLARWFVEPNIAAVCGRLVLVDPRTGRNVDSLYWKYETSIKRCEGRLGALLGANGAIYAIRRESYVPIPDNTIIDDFVIPLLIKQQQGGSIIYDAEAVAWEDTPPDIGSEFGRRSRIGAGGFQCIGLLWRLLMPKHGWLALSFLSHKVLRWLGPFALVVLLVTNLMLVDKPVYQATIFAQLLMYATAVLGLVVPRRGLVSRLVGLATMFVGMNAALLVGFWRWLSGRQQGVWSRTARADPFNPAQF